MPRERRKITFYVENLNSGNSSSELLLPASLQHSIRNIQFVESHCYLYCTQKSNMLYSSSGLFKFVSLTVLTFLSR
jgi:hypothetical protein